MKILGIPGISVGSRTQDRAHSNKGSLQTTRTIIKSNLPFGGTDIYNKRLTISNIGNYHKYDRYDELYEYRTNKEISAMPFETFFKVFRINICRLSAEGGNHTTRINISIPETELNR